MNRRQFSASSASLLTAAWMGGASGLAQSAAAQTVANVPLQWAGYADTLAIDGLGGIVGAETKQDGTLSALDLQNVRDSGLSAVRLSLAPQGAFWFNDAAFQRTLAAISTTDRQIIRYPDALARVLKGEDIVRAHREHKLGLIYGFQDTSPIGEDLDRIELFWNSGVRVIQLTHNRRNLVGDGAMEPGNAGLSNFGMTMIEALNARRMVVDLAHGGRRTTSEAIRASKAPVIISHTGCAALADVPRCATDESLRALADRGGVAGIIFWPYLRKQGQPMAIDVIHHIEHAIKVCGEDHVGIGTDSSLAPVERTPEFEKQNRAMIEDMIEQGVFEKDRDPDLHVFIPDLNHASRFQTLGAMLSARGHSDTRIAKVLGGNFARVMGEIWG